MDDINVRISPILANETNSLKSSGFKEYSKENINNLCIVDGTYQIIDNYGRNKLVMYAGVYVRGVRVDNIGVDRDATPMFETIRDLDTENQIITPPMLSRTINGINLWSPNDIINGLPTLIKSINPANSDDIYNYYQNQAGGSRRRRKRTKTIKRKKGRKGRKGRKSRKGRKGRKSRKSRKSRK